MARLQGRRAFITGGGAGIGRAAADLFAHEGASVCIVDIDGDKAEAAAREIGERGGTVLGLAVDVTDEDQVAGAVRAAAERFGGLDVLFNSAGGSRTDDDDVAEVDMEIWAETMDLNLKGTFLACRHVVPHMLTGGGGAIVNMSSGAALRGASPAHIYTASKGAILSLTRALAGRYARDNIRANAIAAGRIHTERIVAAFGRTGEAGPLVDRQKPEERAKEYPFWVGEPVDIARVALFLACDESRMITGATIPADGGRSAY